MGCPTDCLIQVNPADGTFIRNWGPTSYDNVFGLAFWAGAVCGFDAQGDLFEADFHGAAMQVSLLPIPNLSEAGMLSFQGAGSTTSAPPNPPSNRERGGGRRSRPAFGLL